MQTADCRLGLGIDYRLGFKHVGCSMDKLFKYRLYYFHIIYQVPEPMPCAYIKYSP